MAAISLNSLRDFTIFCYGTHLIDDLEFILLHDYSQSKDIYP